MEKLLNFLYWTVEELAYDNYLSINGIEECYPQNEIEHMVIEAVKGIGQVADENALKEQIKHLDGILELEIPSELKHQLFRLVIELYNYITDYESARSCAKKYEASGLDDMNAIYLLALINLRINTKESLLASIDYTNKLLEFSSDDYVAILIKCDALTILYDHKMALTVIDDFLPKVSKYSLSVLLQKKFQIFLEMKEIEKAFELVEKEKIHVFGYYYKQAFESLPVAIDTAKEYINKHPEDTFVFGILADICENIDEKINYYELAKDEYYANVLMRLYEKRGNLLDVDKYFELAKQILNAQAVSRYNLMKIIYGAFARFDNGIIEKMLEKFELDNSKSGCGLTLIGKAYECGIGVEKNAEKAFEYYLRAKNAGDETCDCGTFFVANCLLYGLGTKQDKEQAKLEILSIIDRRVEADRYCLYAIFALEGDPRFSKEKAKEFLISQNHYPACNLLLYKLTKGTSEALEHLEQFKMTLINRDYLERQWYSQYLDNYDAEYIHFVTN